MSPSRCRPEFVLLLAALLVWGCGSFPPVSPSTQVPGPASTTASPSASPAALPAGSMGTASPPSLEAIETATGTLSWQRVPTSTGIAGGSSRGLKLRDLATVPGGLIAVGGDVRGAVILSSPDGAQWTRARDEAAFDYATLKAVAAQGALTVAVGTISGSARGLLWTTTDGLTWRGGGYAFAGNIEVAGVAAGGSSFVVAGSFRMPADASGLRRVVGAAWASADGRTWDRFVMPSDAATGDFRLTSVTFAGSRFVALGRPSGGNAHAEMLVWTSADGRKWQRGEDIPVGQAGSIGGVARGPTGALVAVGWTTATPSHAAVFTSPEGIRWTPVPDEAALDGAVMRGLACDERHCLAVGETAGASPSNAATWTTTDGVTWSRTGSMSGLGDVGMGDVALTGSGAVTIGWAVSPFENTSYVNQAAFWITPPVGLPAPVLPAEVATIAGHWESLPPMTTPRIDPAVAVGKDGRIYVFGGKTRPVGTATTIQTSSVEIFDPATNAWSLGAPIPGPGRIRAAAVTAADGRIFLFHATNSLVLVYDPARSAWTTGPAVPSGKHVSAAVAGPGPLVSVVTPGSPVTSGSTTFWLNASPFWLYSLDPTTAQWRSRVPTWGFRSRRGQTECCTASRAPGPGQSIQPRDRRTRCARLPSSPTLFRRRRARVPSSGQLVRRTSIHLAFAALSGHVPSSKPTIRQRTRGWSRRSRPSCGGGTPSRAPAIVCTSSAAARGRTPIRSKCSSSTL